MTKSVFRRHPPPPRPLPKPPEKKSYLAEDERNFTLSFVETMRVSSLKLELLYILVGESSLAAQAPLIASSKLLRGAIFYFQSTEKVDAGGPKSDRPQQLLETGAKYRNLLRSVRKEIKGDIGSSITVGD